MHPFEGSPLAEMPFPPCFSPVTPVLLWTVYFYPAPVSLLLRGSFWFAPTAASLRHTPSPPRPPSGCCLQEEQRQVNDSSRQRRLSRADRAAGRRRGGSAGSAHELRGILRSLQPRVHCMRLQEDGHRLQQDLDHTTASPQQKSGRKKLGPEDILRG
ncbi:hypothetical protein NDU88_003151 [Pleurodeles waltl]|uniref:Uncharacterized protein n=1 Tax=Pleurodeles waltl TaxID=8319 RepID=A0AAV7W4T8_PLEWA|nr:hypothetical protein NDU88_003151 [Pleurodeles waltl]